MDDTSRERERASWADAIYMIDQRLPRVYHVIGGRLTGGDSQGCLGALVRATESLDRDGFVMRPWEISRGLLQSRMQCQTSGSMAGNITRLPLPSSTFGRPWSLPRHAPQIRPICVLTLDRAPALCCTELRLAIEQLTPDPVAVNALWPECVGRPVPQSGATSAFGT